MEQFSRLSDWQEKLLHVLISFWSFFCSRILLIIFGCQNHRLSLLRTRMRTPRDAAAAARPPMVSIRKPEAVFTDRFTEGCCFLEDSGSCFSVLEAGIVEDSGFSRAVFSSAGFSGFCSVAPSSIFLTFRASSASFLVSCASGSSVVISALAEPHQVTDGFRLDQRLLN